MSTTFLIVFGWVAAIASQAGPADPATARMASEHNRIGWQYLAAEDFESARDAFVKATDLDRRFASAFYGLGKSYMGLRQYEPAILAYGRARDIYVEDAAASYGNQMSMNQNIQTRIRELREAIREQTNTTARAASAAAGQHRIVRELDEQIRQLEIMLKSGRSSPEMSVPAEVYLALGSAHFRAEHISEAEREYRTAIRIRPNFGEAYSNLAVICLLTKRYDEADRHVKSAEKAGFRVNPDLKDEIRTKKGGS